MTASIPWTQVTLASYLKSGERLLELVDSLARAFPSGGKKAAATTSQPKGGS